MLEGEGPRLPAIVQGACDHLTNQPVGAGSLPAVQQITVTRRQCQRSPKTLLGFQLLMPPITVSPADEAHTP